MPLGWTFSPGATQLLPNVVQWAAAGASANDSFVGAPSGVGYIYADLVADQARLGEVASATAALMAAAGMRLLNVIGSVPAVESIGPLLREEQLDALFWRDATPRPPILAPSAPRPPHARRYPYADPRGPAEDPYAEAAPRPPRPRAGTRTATATRACAVTWRTWAGNLS